MEIVFSEDEAPARARFLTELFHPHGTLSWYLTFTLGILRLVRAVTSDGIPLYTIGHSRRDLVANILASVTKLLKTTPNPSPATWANVRAAKMYFSADENVKKEYRKQVARLVRRSVEGDD